MNQSMISQVRDCIDSDDDVAYVCSALDCGVTDNCSDSNGGIASACVESNDDVANVLKSCVSERCEWMWGVKTVNFATFESMLS